MARPRSDIRPRLIEAARRRFLEDGVDGASLRSIANDAATNIGMVVYYFPTKEDLFFAVVEETAGRLLDDLERIAGAGPDPLLRLRRLFHRIAEASPDEDLVVRLVTREALGSAARRAALVARLLRGHVPALAALFSDGIRDGTFGPERHPWLLLMAALALAGPPQLLARQRPAPAVAPLSSVTPVTSDFPAGAALADELVDMLMNGIAGPGGADERARGRRRTRDRRLNR
jgi:AcrR family transcriptional regulator